MAKKNPLIRSYPKRVNKPLPNKSAGILDDFAVRRVVATKELYANYIQFNTAFSDGQAEGRLQWNTEDGTLEVGMPGGNVNLQIGQEQLIKVFNSSGVNITNGQPVRISGGQANTVTVELSNATDAASGVIALATEDIDNNSFGFVTTMGLVRGVDTNSWVPGTALFLGETDGAITNTPPVNASRKVFLGAVIRQNASEGIIYCSIVNTSFIEELSGNADGAGNPTLTIDSTNGEVGINGALDMKTHQINNVVDPTSAQDSATKQYVDDATTPIEYSANSISTVTGTPTGSVSDVQTKNDSNTYDVDEVAGVPGFDTRITYTGVDHFNSIKTHVQYNGSLSHVVNLQLWNVDTTTWDTIAVVPVSVALQDLIVQDIDHTDYIDSGTVILRFYHATTGNAAHDLIIDYAAVWNSFGGSAGAQLWESDAGVARLKSSEPINMQTQKITGVVDPTANQEAATKKYVDDNIPTVTHRPSITLESPSDTEDVGWTFVEKAITVSEIRAVLVGSDTPSVTWTIRFNSDRSAAGTEVVTGGTTTTSTTTGSDVTALDDATIPADSFIWIETTAQSGTVTQLHVTFVFTED